LATRPGTSRQIISSIIDVIDPSSLQLVISETEEIQAFAVKDKNTSIQYDVEVRGRRLGQDPGNDVLNDYGAVLKTVRDTSLLCVETYQ
jgi:hypothetical protein